MAKRLSKSEHRPWKGTLSLLVKKKKEYNFKPLYWVLIPKEDGAIWITGYETHIVGSKLVLEFQIKAFTRDFGLPDGARPLCSGGEHPICLQTPDDVIFMTADSKTFRSQKFKGHLITTFRRLNTNWRDLKLCLVTDKMIIVAGLSRSMHKELHVGDVIRKVNNHSLPFVKHFYDLIESSDTDEIKLEILRVPNGCLCHVTLPGNGQIEHLGVSFSERKRRGVEVSTIDEDGLVFKSHDIQNSFPEAVTKPTKRVNWGLVEINQRPVPLDSSRKQVEELLCNAGIELALIFLPMDLVLVLRDACYEK